MEFMLEGDVVYLNHGSFGACPVEVFDEYQRLQRRLEAHPVRFLQRERPGLAANARAALAEFVGAGADEVAFVTNPTYAVNEIARSIPLGPGDEVLTTNHEYGACRNVWQYIAERTGCSLVEAPLPITLDTDDDVVDSVYAAASENTKVLFVSHISSATAMTFPVAQLCARARRDGILTIVDGAHGPGQLDLDVAAIGADFYVGACHKWMCAPKGVSFIAAGRAAQERLEPLIVGWGWGDFKQIDVGSPFLDHHEWLGTHDPAAMLTVPVAIAFQRRHGWAAVRAACHERAAGLIETAEGVAGVTRVHADHRYEQMALLELGGSFRPDLPVDVIAARLREENIEVPVWTWYDAQARPHRLIRVSVQAYNTVHDLDRLVGALRDLSS